MTPPSRMIREAAALGSAAGEAQEFSGLLIDALMQDPEVRAAVKDCLRREPAPRARTPGGGRRG